MANNENVLFLEEKVPIRLINKPYCIKCMNPVDESNDVCDFTMNPVHYAMNKHDQRTAYTLF